VRTKQKGERIERGHNTNSNKRGGHSRKGKEQNQKIKRITVVGRENKPRGKETLQALNWGRMQKINQGSWWGGGGGVGREKNG